MGEGGSAFLVVQLPSKEEQKEENVLADRKKQGKHTHTEANLPLGSRSHQVGPLLYERLGELGDTS